MPEGEICGCLVFIDHSFNSGRCMCGHIRECHDPSTGDCTIRSFA